MDFIFMLTHHDRTVDDGLAILDEILPLGVRHIGFKDIGVNIDTLDRLNTTIKTAGATSYLEVVSTGAEASLGEREGVTQEGVVGAIADILTRFDLPSRATRNTSPDRLMLALMQDKKKRGGAVRFALLERIGASARNAGGEWTRTVSDQTLLEVLNQLST